MCADPITLLTIASTVISAGGAVAGGIQAKQMGDYQGKAYEQQAQADAQATAFEMGQERKRQELLQANARAQVGASGVALAGSPTTVLTANARQNELDLAAMRYGSQLRQNGLGTQASISRYSGKQARTAGYIEGASTLMSGLKSVKFGGGNNPFARPDAWAGMR